MKPLTVHAMPWLTLDTREFSTIQPADFFLSNLRKKSTSEKFKERRTQVIRGDMADIKWRIRNDVARRIKDRALEILRDHPEVGMDSDHEINGDTEDRAFCDVISKLNEEVKK